MTLLELSPGITRIRILSGESPSASPVLFSDEHGEYLRQTGCVFSPRPVWRLSGSENGGEVKQTANGEVVVFGEGGADLLRISHSAELRFACPEGQILTGLGQHEEGIFDYARKEERLYQHNMKIALLLNLYLLFYLLKAHIYLLHHLYYSIILHYYMNHMDLLFVALLMKLFL